MQDDEMRSEETDTTTESQDEAGPSSRTQGPTRRSHSRQSSAMSTWSAQHQAFLMRMQSQQNEWLESQIQQTLEREERLLSTIVQINSRSNERMVSLLVESFRSIQPQPPPMFVTPYQEYHPAPQNHRMHAPVVNNFTYDPVPREEREYTQL
ncbi:hypothetical protein SKAU_G00262470 [Synaphobranchus kaupii]|uniref:Uncharacterized protein n=1 Tax=Synaphobranchus kaupii TaxID=118154 RepID=A0A9Q1EYQ9_SYNKA|nr:hypothetical protein SKAU_G00262470 [Synaphobranchus kaupii]